MVYAIHKMVANVTKVGQAMIVSQNSLLVNQKLLHVPAKVLVQKKKDVFVKLVSQVKNVIFLNSIVLTLDLNARKKDFAWNGMENVDVLELLEETNVKLQNSDVWPIITLVMGKIEENVIL